MIAWLKLRLLAAASIVGLLVAAYFKIKSIGKNEERVKDLQKRIDSMRKKEEVSREVDRLPDGDAVKRLRDTWTRD
jgi:hypothetical protein